MTHYINKISISRLSVASNWLSIQMHKWINWTQSKYSKLKSWKGKKTTKTSKSSANGGRKIKSFMNVGTSVCGIFIDDVNARHNRAGFFNFSWKITYNLICLMFLFSIFIFYKEAPIIFYFSLIFFPLQFINFSFSIFSILRYDLFTDSNRFEIKGKKNEISIRKSVFHFLICW